jgi:predicted TPR repeat methyltransferase
MTGKPHAERRQARSDPEERAGEPDMLERARSLHSPAEALALYHDWAKTYDRDIYERLRFTGTARIAALLARHLDDRFARVIDLGCGTGAAGAELRRLGFGRVDGLDLSPDMLAIARRRSVYAEVFTADLLGPLPVADAAYDAAISAGTFTSGHVGAAALPEVLRIVKPQGLIACVVGASFWGPGGFRSVVGSLRAQRRVLALHDSVEPIRHGGPPEGRFLVLRRL